MRLLVVRHGRTASNAEGRYQGSIDTDLDEVGVAQAHALDGALPRDLDLVVASPMRRARRTAEIFCASRGLPLLLDARFRERSVGIYEGLTAPEVRERHPDLWAHDVTRRWDDAPPNGESIGELFQRLTGALAEIRDAHDGQRVVLVAHGFVGKAIRAICTGRYDDYFDWLLGNGQVLDVTIPAHLPGDLATFREAFVAGTRVAANRAADA
jgi:broad specificity phosphatase PhoE